MKDIKCYVKKLVVLNIICSSWEDFLDGFFIVFWVWVFVGEKVFAYLMGSWF